MLEIYLHPQCITARGVELELVIIAEPVGFRPARDGPDGGQLIAFAVDYMVREASQRDCAADCVSNQFAAGKYNIVHIGFLYF